MEREGHYSEILTPDEAASYLRVTRQTIYNLVWKKKMPAYKIGTHWRLKRAELDEP